MKELGVQVYGQRHKIIKGIGRYRSLISTAASNSTSNLSSSAIPTTSSLPAIENLLITQRSGTGGAHFKGVGVHEPMPPGSDYFPAAAATETVFVDVPRDSNEFRDVEEQVSSISLS